MKIKYFLIIILFSLTLISCGNSHIEDTNGIDDYSLCYFQREDLIKNTNSTSYMSSESSFDNKFTYSCKRLSGSNKIRTIETNGDNVKFKVEVNIESGNALVGLVNDNSIIYIFPLNETSTFTLSKNYSKVYFKILGESANIKVSVELSKA